MLQSVYITISWSIGISCTFGPKNTHIAEGLLFSWSNSPESIQIGSVFFPFKLFYYNLRRMLISKYFFIQFNTAFNHQFIWLDPYQKIANKKLQNMYVFIGILMHILGDFFRLRIHAFCVAMYYLKYVKISRLRYTLIHNFFVYWFL